LINRTNLDLPGFQNLEGLPGTLTTPLNPIPLLILPPFEKCLLAERRFARMVLGMMLQITLVSVVAGQAAHAPPKRFELA
jgi:hypothetical protein